MLTRREVLHGIALSATALSFKDAIVSPSGGLRVDANEKLTVACIGVGSQGMRVLLDLLRLAEVQIVAVCDVNRASSDYLEWGPNELRTKVRQVLGDASWGNALQGPTAGRYVAQKIVNTYYGGQNGKRSYFGCNAYEDYRQLLTTERDLDAVIVSTPDHWHAPIAIAAMRAGKHVYSQKPMAHSVWECREMARVAKDTGRATQVSIFNSDSAASRQVHDLLNSGAIGTVKTIDIWTKRASSFWKQGLATPVKADPIPEGLNWDMWLGPAPARPFSRSYMPFIWRAWYDFGCGALGDMGEYGFDTISRAVGLETATRIEASTTDLFRECYPVASSIHFNFNKTAVRPALTLNWFDGGIEPQRPSELPSSSPMGTGGEGVVYTGSSGKLMTAFMGENPRLIAPSGKITSPTDPSSKPGGIQDQAFLPASPQLGPTASGADPEHYREWIRACRGGPAARANYAYEAPIVETLLLGCIAVRTHEVLTWDASKFALVGGSAHATALLKPSFAAHGD